MIGQCEKQAGKTERGAVSRNERSRHEAFQAIMRENRANQTVYAVVTPVMNGTMLSPSTKGLR